MHPKRTRHDTHTQKMAWSTWEWTCNEQSKSIRFYIFLERKRVFMVKWQFSFHSVIPSVSLAIFSTRRLSNGFVEYSQAAYFAIRLIVERILATYLFIQLTVLVSYIMKFKIHSNEVLCISNLFIYIYLVLFHQSSVCRLLALFRFHFEMNSFMIYWTVVCSIRLIL